MKNSFGQALSVTLFGESHGEKIGAVLDGLAPGIKIDSEYISKRLALRRPAGKISTARVEPDEYEIVSGVFSGYTTGTPLCILISNTDTKSEHYKELSDLPRPSHADYAAECKYHGFQDLRGGGHFSARITAALVAAGAIVASALKDKGIYIGSHIQSLLDIEEASVLNLNEAELKKLSLELEKKYFPVLSESTEERMKKKIEEARAEGDSVGGVLESFVAGIPAGLGEPWFDSVESLLSHLIFSVPAVKGVEFGLGFGLTKLYGSQANDPYIVKDGKIATETNNNGGIGGGITNGMPIVLRTAIKPTPSILKEQRTVSLSTLTERTLKITGRHDPAVVHRARAVIDAVIALGIADMLTLRYGTDYLANS